MPVSPELAPRRYADICHKNFTQWGVWDPTRTPKVGSYGHININTGALDVEGNVYDPGFQRYLDECDGIKIADHPPEFLTEEFKSVLTSIWTRKEKDDFKAPPDAPEGVDSATTKGQWYFQKGRSCVVLLLHKPRQQVLPGIVLEELFKVPKLKHKHLVTKVVHCSAYARYLTSTDGEHITLSLRGSEKEPSDDGVRPALEWYTHGCEPGYLQTGANQDGELAFAPFFYLRQKYPLIRSLLRDWATPDPKPDSYWCNTFPPWKPLEEDGTEGDYEVDRNLPIEAQRRATGDIAGNHLYGTETED